MSGSVGTLHENICNEANRASVVRDAAALVSDEVRSKSGLSGVAIKTAFKAVSKVSPGLVESVVDNLLDKFVLKLEPFFTEWNEAGRQGTFESFLTGQSNKVANALLSVTDDRARTVDNKVLKKSYSSLRPQGEKNVQASIPGLGRLLDKYIK